jgi:AIPR protein
VSIRYDANNPSLIKYHAEGLKGLVCSTSAKEIAKIVLNDATGAVFDSNIRRFLGTRGAVNADIMRTCSDTSVSNQFWFLNNGITVICDTFDPVTDPDNAHVKIKNMQIVNGCQTATALALVEKAGKLATDTRVMLRVYETADAQLVDKIVLTTNNQNKISSRDLRSNDKVQIDMQEAFSKYNLYYEIPTIYFGKSRITAFFTSHELLPISGAKPTTGKIILTN